MKNFQFRSLTGLIFALLFISNISLVVIAVINSNDLYAAYAILLSCAQFYLYRKFKILRIFFECDVHQPVQASNYGRADKKSIKRYEINLN